jgi:hypothetical protein
MTTITLSCWITDWSGIFLRINNKIRPPKGKENDHENYNMYGCICVPCSPYFRPCSGSGYVYLSKQRPEPEAIRKG